MAGEFLSPELQLARSSTTGSGDPQWVKDLRAQSAARDLARLQNPGGVLAGIDADAAALKRRQDAAFSQAIGGNLKQLGIERAHAEGSGFLRPEQVGALIALRDGATSSSVLGSSLSGGASLASSGAPPEPSELPAWALPVAGVVAAGLVLWWLVRR